MVCHIGWQTLKYLPSDLYFLGVRMIIPSPRIFWLVLFMPTQIVADLMVSLVLMTDRTAKSDVSSESMMQNSEPQLAAFIELVL